LLADLEGRATEQGNEACRLESTETARCFYLARSYIENGSPRRKFGTTSGYPMSTRIRAPA
jgi:hypothetical protein